MANLPVGRVSEKRPESPPHSVEDSKAAHREGSDSWLTKGRQAELRCLLVLATSDTSKWCTRALAIEMGVWRHDGAGDALHRCEDAGWVQVKWGQRYQTDGAAAPTYARLTQDGLAHLMASRMGGVYSRQTTPSTNRSISSSLSEAPSRSLKEERHSYQAESVGGNRRRDHYRLNSPMFNQEAYGLLGLLLCTELAEGIHRRSLDELAEMARLTRKQMRGVLARWIKKGLPLVDASDPEVVVIQVPDPTDDSQQRWLAGADLAERYRVRVNHMIDEQADFKEAIGTGFSDWSQAQHGIPPADQRRGLLLDPPAPAPAVYQPPTEAEQEALRACIQAMKDHRGTWVGLRNPTVAEAAEECYQQSRSRPRTIRSPPKKRRRRSKPTRVCSVPDCEGKFYYRGLCESHHNEAERVASAHQAEALKRARAVA
jgi:hypothetical protein